MCKCSLQVISECNRQLLPLNIAGAQVAEQVLLGAMNLFALLLLPAHGVTVLVLARDRAREMRRWLMAAGCAVLVIAPLMVIAWRQRADIEWIPPLNRHEAGTMAAWGGTLAVSQLS